MVRSHGEGVRWDGEGKAPILSTAWSLLGTGFPQGQNVPGRAAACANIHTHTHTHTSVLCAKSIPARLPVDTCLILCGSCR